MNFQRLHYFCSMVEEGGIHKAARRLGISQPPLSLTLKELENELGCMLVYRSSGKWIITEAGRRLYEEARAVLAMVRSMKTRVRQTAAEIHGEARVGFSTSCVFMFNRVLPRMCAAYPQVTCKAKFTDSGSLAKHTRQREVDFSVLYLPVNGQDFEIMPLKPQRLMAIFSKKLPVPPEGELHLRQICDYPLLLPMRWKGGGIYTIFASAVQALGLSPNIICQTQAPYVLLGLLNRLAAVAILPQGENGDGDENDFPARAIRELGEPLVPAIVKLGNTYIPHPSRRMMDIILDEYGA